MAAPGLHTKVLQVIADNEPAPARVLDFGAGKGALCGQLIERGYEVVAADINQEDFFHSERARFHRLDFNDVHSLSAFTKAHKHHFDVVVGTEVIEHLENPWSYVRSMAEMARPGGLVVVTTPNVGSWHSRLTFLRRGEWDDFGARGQHGHITPLAPWLLERIMREAGVLEVWLEPAGAIHEVPLFRQRIMRLISLALRPVQEGQLNGFCTVALGRTRSQ